MTMEIYKVYKNHQFIEEGKSLRIFRARRQNREEPRHVHEFIEIIYILRGCAKHEIDDRSYEVSHGDMLFINYGSTHAFSSSNFDYINICFSPEVISNSLITERNAFALLSLTAFNEICNESDGARLTFRGRERQQIEDILAAMLAESKEKQTGWDRVVENYFHILITKMLRKTEQGMEGQELGDVWRELSDYIDANLDTELSLGALAKKCFYNPSYFSRVFKEKFGTSLVEYVNRRRVEGAVKLLREGELSVDEISERVGFSDRSNFYRAFSKYLHTTPTDYRRQYSEENSSQESPSDVKKCDK